jgi:hypothetical protein
MRKRAAEVKPQSNVGGERRLKNGPAPKNVQRTDASAAWAGDENAQPASALLNAVAVRGVAAWRQPERSGASLNAAPLRARSAGLCGAALGAAPSREPKPPGCRAGAFCGEAVLGSRSQPCKMRQPVLGLICRI